MPSLPIPAWDSPWNRPLALLELSLQPILIPLAVVMYGVTEIKAQLRHMQRLLKILRTGKTGPYRGIGW